LKGFLVQLFNILTPKEKNRLFILAGFDLLMGLADIVFLVLLLLIIRIYTSDTAVLPTTAFLSPVYRILINTNPVYSTGLFVALFCIKNLAGVWVSKSQHKFVYGVASRLSERNINDYLKGSYANFVHVDSSLRIRHISNVPIEFGHYVLTNFQQVIAQSILIVFTIAAILLYHPVLFILLLVLLLPPVILLGWFTRHQLKKVRTQIKQSSTRVIQYLQECLAGYIESNIYQKNNFFVNRYHQHQQQLNQNLAAQQTLHGLSARFIEIFALLGFLLLIAINKWFGSNATINVLTIGVFMAAAYKIIPGAVKIMNAIGQMRTYSFTLNDLANNAENSTTYEVSNPHQRIKNIRITGVSFMFRDQLVVNDLDLEISQNDFVGISGISGKGKTTIVNLLLGFLQQDSGEISINGNETNAVGRQSYWSRIAYVKQQAFFINDTILKNITLADDGYDKIRLERALYLSGLDDFLNAYPEGISKMVKEHGKNISGGQRQRVSLARALYHDFDLLILDEPFSELDNEAEQEILARLSDLNSNGTMMILITHNKTSLAYCNKIILPDAVQA
jgi:ABC-type bacteriocin/lantibiotic exporter with double-glycine peptidase domain